MNAAGHTPLPWTLEEDRTVSPDAVVYRMYGPGRRYIGTVGVGTDVPHLQTADWLPAEEARANALAIHATLVLLEACRAALDFLDQPVRDGVEPGPLHDRLVALGGSYTRRLLTDAISHATGGAP